MRDVAVVAFAQAPCVHQNTAQNEVEIVMPVVAEAVEASGIPKQEIGFTVSGSCDYLVGVPFSFVTALDAVGAWPPIEESHVEMDGAWALYEAWVRLQHGDIDTALVYCFGKSSMTNLSRVLTNQLDPYYLMPLWPEANSLAALQARMLIDAGLCSEADMAETVAAARRNAKQNPNALVSGDFDAKTLLAEPYVASPLRGHDCGPSADSAAAVVLVAGDRAQACCDRPAWIRGIDHRIEAHALGVRDLTASVSTKLAAQRAGLNGGVDVAELCAPYSHQEVLLRKELGLDAARVNPSGGALAAHPFMVAGLTRIGEAATRIMNGSADRALAHATSGPCLQQNLVCVLEGE